MRTLLLSAAVLLTAAAGVASASGPAAHAAKTCSAPKYPGTGYFTSMTVTKTTCPTGKKVAVAQYRCRMSHGGAKGKCPASTSLSGFKCSEGARHAIPTEFNARVTCKNGSKRVVFTYQQDT